MPNIIIKPWDQSAPNVKYDPVLAREASRGKVRDWDRIDWEAMHPVLRRHRAAAGLDAEMDRPEFHDPALELLEQRAHLERLEHRPEQWVEENMELYEANCEKAREQHLPQQERWARNLEQRLVNILHPSQVMRRLRHAGVDARECESPHARIWLNDWSCQGLIGVNAWVTPQEMDEDGYLMGLAAAETQKQKDLLTANFHACREGRKVQRTLTSLQEPYGPEWSVMRFNTHGVATKEKFRGWRTAMLVLIVADIVTEDEVNRAFGPPLGEAGAWYREQLQVWRRIKLGRV